MSPHHTPFGEEVIEFLHGLESLHNLRIHIVSESGWTWALAWAQLGVRVMNGIAFTELSMDYGRQVISILNGQGFDLSLQSAGRLSAAGRRGPNIPHVVCGHLLSSPGRSILAYLGSIPATSFLLLTLDRSALPLLQQYIGEHCRWEEIRHRRLGGLTAARVIVVWRSHSKVADDRLRPGERHSPLRPLSAFLEASTRLTEWRMADSQCALRARQDLTCWCPASSSPRPYPWPWSEGPRWVETTSVYLGSALIQRPLTEKEFAQLMDLREAWGPPLVKTLMEWDRGATPPLRMCRVHTGGCPLAGNGFIYQQAVYNRDFKCGNETQRICF
jgi:hypothetical protein